MKDFFFFPLRTALLCAQSSDQLQTVLSPDDFVGTWGCRSCGRSFRDTEMGFDLDMERRLEERVLALDERLNVNPDVEWDELMKWFMAGLHMLGRRHWLVAKVCGSRLRAKDPSCDCTFTCVRVSRGCAYICA